MLKSILKGAASVETHRNPSMGPLRDVMSRFKTDGLVGISPEAFKAEIDRYLALDDAAMEGLDDASRQRDQAIKFNWGHNHDFGSFALEGQMKDRHLEILSIFIDEFGAMPMDLTGKRVLDIGCWTGGTCLTLAGMGAEVVGIEEVRKYAECAQFLADSFGLGDKITVERRSLYDITDERFQDAFDIVLFSGVIYHLTDPVLGARHCFNALKDGGRCLTETFSIDRSDMLVEYTGPGVLSSSAGTAAKKNRSGWNWFVLSPPALGQMMRDVGFDDVEVMGPRNARTYSVGTRTRHVDLCRAGLSRPDVR